MKKNLHTVAVLLLLSWFHFQNSMAFAQGTAFTYQGRLSDGGSRANGTYDLQFTLFDAPASGNQIGSPVTRFGVGVTNGYFTSTIDFGPGVFTGTNYWLQIGVETNGSFDGFTVLSALQPLTPAPYAIYSASANGVAAGAVTGAGIAAGQVVKSINGLADGVTLSPGANVTITPSGNTLTIASTGGGGGGLPPDVALTDHSQIFTGTNTFYGLGESFIINTGTISTSLFTGLGLQYYNNTGEGAIMSSFNDGLGYLTFYTKPGNGLPVVRQMMIDRYGGVAIDQQNANSGVIDNGTSGGVGLTFGTGSGEGIASRRTAGGNQYGLDFYTSFTDRMSIAQNGTVQFNNDLILQYGQSGLGFRTSVAGVTLGPGGDGPFLWGYDGGALGAVDPDAVSLVWDYAGNVWISNNCSVASLTVRGASASESLSVSGQSLIASGEYLGVTGLGGVQCYLGDDGSGNDVQLGSQKSGVSNIGCFNTADNSYMNLFCNGLTANGSVTCNTGTLSFGNTTRQMLNLYGSVYGIGVQSGAMFFRSDASFSNAGDFSWFRGGTYNGNQNNPGTGGTEMMRLDHNGNLSVLHSITANVVLQTE